MTWTVLIAGPARRDLERLDRSVADRVTRALALLAEGDRGDVQRLRGKEREWRLRVGDWRVRFIYRAEDEVIEVLRVLPRGRAYRR